METDYEFSCSEDLKFGTLISLGLWAGFIRGIPVKKLRECINYLEVNTKLGGIVLAGIKAYHA